MFWRDVEFIQKCGRRQLPKLCGSSLWTSRLWYSCFSRSHDAGPSNDGYSEPNGVNGVMDILAMAHASGLDVALQRSLARETDMARAARFQPRILAWHRRR